MGKLLMGWINGETVAYLPRSYRSFQGASLKKTMLTVIYFNKFDMKLIMGSKMVFLKLNTLMFAHLYLFLLISKLHEFGP